MLLIAVTLSSTASAQEPPHPPTAGHGAKDNQIPGGTTAPLDGGISILLILGTLYGSMKASRLNAKSGL